MTIIHGINLLNYFFVLLLLGGGDLLSAFRTDQLQALAYVFLEAHSYGFTIGIAFLSLHVFVLGYLMLKSGYFPRILGILFLVAGFGYLIDSFGLLLVTSYKTTPDFVALPIAIAEIAFPLWLLFKGVNVKQWQKHTLVMTAPAPSA